MSLEDGQKIYKLKHPLSYKCNGETLVATFLELREPSMSHSRGYHKIKQMVIGLLMSSAQKLEELNLDQDDILGGTEIEKLDTVNPDAFEEEAEKFAEMLGFLFGLSTEIQLANFVEDFEKIACNSRQKSICVIQGEIPMDKAIWEEMHPADAGGAAQAWAAFFTIPSGLKGSIESASASGSPTLAKGR